MRVRNVQGEKKERLRQRSIQAEESRVRTDARNKLVGSAYAALRAQRTSRRYVNTRQLDSTPITHQAHQIINTEVHDDAFSMFCSHVLLFFDAFI
jgi:hypothetical protein